MLSFVVSWFQRFSGLILLSDISPGHWDLKVHHTSNMADMEKTDYTVNSESDHGVRDIVATKGAAMGEAADIYGDVATAEQYGYVERG